MRIMTNYLQILATALAFNLNFPSYLTETMGSTKSLGASQEIFLSFDCLLLDSRVTELFDNVAYIKVICMALIPIFMILVSCTIFSLVFFRNLAKFKRYWWVTIITILFLFYPPIVQFWFRIFKCNDIGAGQSRIKIDASAACWSSQHLKWVYKLGIPMLVVYVISLPIIALLILYIFRKKLNEQHVITYILLLYQGLSPKRYYWELVNTFRKVCLLGLHVFLPNDMALYKALVGVFILFAISILQARLQPYKIILINQLEYREMMASVVTLYSGVIYIQETDGHPEIGIFQVVFFAFVIITNARFVILWIYALAWVYRRKKYVDRIASWYKNAFCLKVSHVDEDILCYKLKWTTADDERSWDHTIHYRDTIKCKPNLSIYTSRPDVFQTTNKILKSVLKKNYGSSKYHLFVFMVLWINWVSWIINSNLTYFDSIIII